MTKTYPVTAAVIEKFDRFWDAYPEKSGKGAARIKFAVAIHKTTLTAMLKAIEWQKESRQWKEGFIPYPATWLFQERWTDEPKKKTPTEQHSLDEHNAAIDQQMDLARRREAYRAAGKTKDEIDEIFDAEFDARQK